MTGVSTSRGSISRTAGWDGLRWSKHLQLAVIRSFGIRVFAPIPRISPIQFLFFFKANLRTLAGWSVFGKKCGGDIQKKIIFLLVYSQMIYGVCGFNHWEMGRPYIPSFIYVSFFQMTYFNLHFLQMGTPCMPYLYHFNYSIYPRYHHFSLGFYGDPGTFSFACTYIYIYIPVCMCGSRSKDNIERVGIYIYTYDITPYSHI